jgi:hypothetical protein
MKLHVKIKPKNISFSILQVRKPYQKEIVILRAKKCGVLPG